MTADDEVCIRSAQEGDLPIIYSMIEDLADHLGLAHEVVVSEEDLQQALFGKQPRAEVVLALVAGEAAGFALFYGNYSTFRGQCGLHLEDLYVEPQWRGYGLGRRLLSYLAGLTISRGCRRLEWWVQTTDSRAVRFYEMLDAKAKDEWTVYRLAGEPLQRLAEAPRK
ncbi:MAG: GNAT family N-acetyltransferase [Gammaproteobacteria bacterium]|nr:GNAT family N-acetyltransferase [Gammaproteobacteria bacterium]MCW8928453.1 GNAT family N-acetyltransferase [Gammaproteobacteria bacterium]MCW8957421.1 GNAT family N-acetyltransferase [Gammaproteobacteria bacterium]MCW8973667.1 GNAT family N-acetyltransferase [Gammaproteobacteria bacterium]MCW8992464.1 GNAT family N-acetyltransferase [Gammaproteobacteria bacterium]